jgi:hypothetical protein
MQSADLFLFAEYLGKAHRGGKAMGMRGNGYEVSELLKRDGIRLLVHAERSVQEREVVDRTGKGYFTDEG